MHILDNIIVQSYISYEKSQQVLAYVDEQERSIYLKCVHAIHVQAVSSNQETGWMRFTY